MAKVKRRLRLLIADDHELVRHGIRGVLRAERSWAVVGEAENGQEAVQKVLSLRPDLVVLDMTMPVLDGLEATRQIRDRLPDAKVLILTMHESSQMIRRVIEAGARGYVLKSELAKQLVKAVKAVLRGKLSLSPKASELVLSGFLLAPENSKQVDRQEARPTTREVEILRLLARGKSNKEISVELGITVRTVETHRAKIMSKLGLHSVVELVHYATQHGIVSSHTGVT